MATDQIQWVDVPVKVNISIPVQFARGIGNLDGLSPRQICEILSFIDEYEDHVDEAVIISDEHYPAFFAFKTTKTKMGKGVSGVFLTGKCIYGTAFLSDSGHSFGRERALRVLQDAMAYGVFDKRVTKSDTTSMVPPEASLAPQETEIVVRYQRWCPFLEDDVDSFDHYDLSNAKSFTIKVKETSAPIDRWGPLLCSRDDAIAGSIWDPTIEDGAVICQVYQGLLERMREECLGSVWFAVVRSAKGRTFGV